MKFIAPQLATLVSEVPTGGGWAFEVKYDGYRMQAHLRDGTVRLLTRRGLDWTDRFPRLAAELGRLTPHSAILDGEMVAPGNEERPFQRLQQALDAGSSDALVFYAFDLLSLDGHDLRPLPWKERRKALAKVIGRRRGRVRVGELLPGPPGALLLAACRLGLEGVIGKRDDAPYQSGRGDSWIKLKCGQRQEFVIVGFTEPRGSRTGLGALLLGVYEKDKLRYAGKVGTGIATELLGTLRAKLDRLVTSTSPITAAPMRLPADAHWVRPTLVAEIAFTEWTAEGLLRHPSFQGLRADKKAREVVRERPVTRARARTTTRRS